MKNSSHHLVSGIPWLTLWILNGLMLTAQAMGETAARGYPTPDTHLGEQLQPGEQRAVQRLTATIEQQLHSLYAPGEYRRDAHPKAHACVRAQFIVLADLPARFNQGVFQAGQQYPAIVRFSNGSPDPDSDDREGDTRGMAIKLQGVSGRKLLAVPTQSSSQDFLLITHPAFFINSASDYARFFEITQSGSWWNYLEIPFLLGLQGTLNALKMLSNETDDPLQARYWSAVPYQFGLGEARTAVKYSVQACETLQAGQEKPPQSPNKLHEALKARLMESGACMEFMVQARSARSMSVEDVVDEWPEEEAEFIKVAHIEFPPQQVNVSIPADRCEAMSYNPWHSIPAHRPLGAINRARLQVYDHIHRVRAAMNRAVPD